MFLFDLEAYPLQRFEASLAGMPVTLELDWQDRANRWRISAFVTASGAPLLEGRAIVTGRNLLGGTQGGPAGGLYCIPRGNNTDAPGFNAWGVTHDLAWLDASDLAEAGIDG